MSIARRRRADQIINYAAWQRVATFLSINGLRALAGTEKATLASVANSPVVWDAIEVEHRRHLGDLVIPARTSNINTNNNNNKSNSNNTKMISAENIFFFATTLYNVANTPSSLVPFPIVTLDIKNNKLLFEIIAVSILQAERLHSAEWLGGGLFAAVTETGGSGNNKTNYVDLIEGKTTFSLTKELVGSFGSLISDWRRGRFAQGLRSSGSSASWGQEPKYLVKRPDAANTRFVPLPDGEADNIKIAVNIHNCIVRAAKEKMIEIDAVTHSVQSLRATIQHSAPRAFLGALMAGFTRWLAGDGSSSGYFSSAAQTAVQVLDTPCDSPLIGSVASVLSSGDSGGNRPLLIYAAVIGSVILRLNQPSAASGLKGSSESFPERRMPSFAELLINFIRAAVVFPILYYLQALWFVSVMLPASLIGLGKWMSPATASKVIVTLSLLSSYRSVIGHFALRPRAELIRHVSGFIIGLCMSPMRITAMQTNDYKTMLGLTVISWLTDLVATRMAEKKKRV